MVIRKKRINLLLSKNRIKLYYSRQLKFCKNLKKLDLKVPSNSLLFKEFNYNPPFFIQNGPSKHLKSGQLLNSYYSRIYSQFRLRKLLSPFSDKNTLDNYYSTLFRVFSKGGLDGSFKKKTLKVLKSRLIISRHFSGISDNPISYFSDFLFFNHS
jgi:hypothetical protein